MSPSRTRGNLDAYHSKRNFAQTAEPLGEGAGVTGSGLRFVIHEHSARRLHWDLRLERDGVLVSWALPRGMPLEPKVNLIAPHTEDHPLEYLEFAGDIPAGNYGAGTMTIWDHGTYEALKWEPRKVEIALHGERIDARYALFAISDEDDPKDWMIHRMDPATDVNAAPMPEHISPMLSRLGVLPREDAGWAYEVKWDGVRAVAYSEPGRLRLEARSLSDITERYPELARLGRALGSHRAVLDGELVSFDATGRPSFAALQQRINSSPAAARRLAGSVPVTYVIFDLLWLDGNSLLELPYRDRHERLAALALEGERWRTPGRLLGSGRDVLEASRAGGLEGIVAKRLDSRYRPGQRDGSWLKIKNTARQEFIVGGWTAGAGRRAGAIGALLLGIYEVGSALRYVGKVGSGLRESDLERLEALLAPIVRESSPFAPGAVKPPRGGTFTEPRLVVEVEFREWTRDGALRAPVFKGLRDDKPVRTVVREQSLELVGGEGLGQRVRARAGERQLNLSNLAKILYPQTATTKREVIDYYAQIAEVLVPHLRDRPLTVKRYPDGVGGKAFFEKNSPRHRPDWVRTVAVPSERRSEIDYTVVDDLPTLIWLANLAALELHAPLAQARDLAHPTAVVFDLDPGPPATIVECCAVALLLAGTFEQLGLESFAKTSGSKGLQVYLPLDRTASFDQTKDFAGTVAQLLEHTQPELVVSRQARSLRPGKVLIDWSQNDPHKTTISVYSLRATPRPTVSTPVSWDEVRATLKSGDPASLSFELGDVLARVASDGDLFAPVLSRTQALPAL